MTADIQQHRGRAATIGNTREALSDANRRARAARTDGRQSKAALGRLLEQLTTPPAIGPDGAIASKGPENALYIQRGHGAPPEPHWGNVVAFLREVVQGEDADEVLEDMNFQRVDTVHLQPSLVIEQDMYRQAELAAQPQAREAQAATRPALPSGAVPPPRNGAELPQRRPIAPTEPPMYPPAPPETPAESTGHLIQRVRAGGHAVTPEQEAAARRDHQSGPSLGPAPDPQFAVTALPGRIGDTVLMPVSAFFGDEVEPAGDDDASEPLPFPGAGTADPSAAPSSAKSGADDD